MATGSVWDGLPHIAADGGPRQLAFGPLGQDGQNNAQHLTINRRAQRLCEEWQWQLRLGLLNEMTESTVQ